MGHLDLESAALSATAGLFEFAALGANVWARARVRLTGSLAEVTIGRTRVTATLHEDGVLSLGRLECQLIEGEHFSTGLENAFAGAGGHVHGAKRQLGYLHQTKIVGHGSHHHGGLSIAAWLLHHARNSRDRHGRPIDAAHVKTLQDDLVELGFRPAGQEPVELDQQTQVDVLAFRLRSSGLSHILVTDIDSHFDEKLLKKHHLMKQP